MYIMHTNIKVVWEQREFDLIRSFAVLHGIGLALEFFLCGFYSLIGRESNLKFYYLKLAKFEIYLQS